MDIVRELRKLGYDVLTSYDAGQANQGIPDEDVLTFAIQQERAVITLNRDDFIELHRSGIRYIRPTQSWSTLVRPNLEAYFLLHSGSDGTLSSPQANTT